MGFLSFLKKKESPAPSIPSPPSAPGVAAVSKFDDRLEPLKPLAPPVPPSGSAPGLPPMPSFNKAPPAPPAPKPLGMPMAPSPMAPSPLAPPPIPKAPAMPREATTPAKAPGLAPPPVPPSMAKPAPKLPELKHRVKETPKPLPPISLEGSRLKNTHVSKAPGMPQVTPPIHGKSLPPSMTRPVAPQPKVLPPSKPIAAVPPEPAVPSDEDIRKVLADLESTPVAFAGNSHVPVVTPLHEAYIPMANFDEALGYLHETGTAVNRIQHLNEKLGHLETQTKTTIENVGKTFENLHQSFLALDAKLFQNK